VTLAVPGRSLPAFSDIACLAYDHESPEPPALKGAARQADLLLTTGFILHEFPFLADLNIPIIIDLYNLFLFENITLYDHEPFYFQVAQHAREVGVLNKLIGRGDFFLCASQRQRDFWLGMLAANNRLNPYNYEQDQQFQKLIAVVPFGIPAAKPVHTKNVLKGAYKTIKADDQVILWGGGIWDWFDPLTLIKALAEVVTTRPQARLFFLGTQHPHEVGVPRMRMVQRAYDLTQSLGLLDTHIFFNDWVSYDERQNFLLEADIGVSLHQATIETHYSFRTRLLDYIWAGLPIIANGGDTLADWVEQEGLGRVVPVGDVAATRDALLELLNLRPGARAVYHRNFEALSARLTWDRVCTPLLDFCRSPRPAPDNVAKAGRQSSNWSQRLGRAQQTLRHEGPLGVVKLGVSYLKWRLTQ
jgi:glycosyltransferase involved in cell wall biosynthesis